MDKKWFGIAAVALLAIGVLAIKAERSPAGAAATTGTPPQVLMLADMREAGGEDGCAKIIKAVQAAEQRHVRVVQFSPGDSSPLLTRYRVLVSPTVLLLVPDGSVSARFEGESPKVIAALESHLAQIRPGE